MLKKILSIIIKIIHAIYFIFVLIGPYIFNDIRILLILIFFYVITITQWYLFNRCLLTDIEDSLAKTTSLYYKDGKPKSFITGFIQEKLNMSEEVAGMILTLIPVINSIVCLIKIYYLCSSCIASNKPNKH
jgi:hypothetical protein